ncbi:DUF3533 domain-containing protein [Nocardia cyriacigeorgica]|uniref:DUF3533 domain-containing protein n=1 Tax=Nocardia cyriacigeorgica TaxID=135487 RepID=A0A5R8PHX4_9NOCA|nr:ABC transporter permease [Nocardia cyriacigeorgica]TLG15629.1 DUF3533 domain-containing protein [Nocardia cyriacigeorgica]
MSDSFVTDRGSLPPTGARSIRFRWIMPVAVVTLFASLLGLMYLAYVANPDQNLHDYPIAVVDNDAGTELGPPGHRTHIDYGAQVLEAITANTSGDRFDLRVVGIDEAQQLMQDGRVYGAVIIPGDFTQQLLNLGAGPAVAGELRRPSITVETNPRLGPFSTSITTRFADQTIESVNAALGPELSARVRQLRPEAPIGAAQLTLEEPVEPIVQPYHGMPEGSGQGLTAFFFALTILLGGMTGAMTIHAIIDSMLGFAPTEYGPYFSHSPAASISRLRTLLIKWGTMAVAAAASSGALIGIGAVLDVHIDRPLALFLYSTFAMTAVGVTALTVMAAVGSVGILVNLIVFVILGMPSAGGTIPVEATPRFFDRLADVEPLRQVYLAVRSLMYFDGTAAAGLDRGVWMTVAGLAVGVVSGVLITALYDRKGLTRAARPAVAALQPA